MFRHHDHQQPYGSTPRDELIPKQVIYLISFKTWEQSPVLLSCVYNTSPHIMHCDIRHVQTAWTLNLTPAAECNYKLLQRRVHTPIAMDDGPARCAPPRGFLRSQTQPGPGFPRVRPLS